MESRQCRSYSTGTSSRGNRVFRNVNTVDITQKTSSYFALCGKKGHTKLACHLTHKFPESGEIKLSTERYELDLVDHEAPTKPLVPLIEDFQQIQPVLASSCDQDVSFSCKSKSLLHVKAWIEGNKTHP